MPVPWNGWTGVIISWRYVLTIMERGFLSKRNGPAAITVAFGSPCSASLAVFWVHVGGA
ncbi:MAG TPA: hypothetical protein VEJ84_19615 [Acidimicrobiales bacterium]|nr:hypothetical protein [Acidimicrobiales bacterium]